jgi:multiple sugar transport system permease protein
MRLPTKRLGLLLLLPMMAFSTVFGLYPLGFAIFLSLTPRVLGAPQYYFQGFGNYLTALRDSYFVNSVTVSFTVVFGAVVLELLVGLGLALLLNMKLRGAKLVRIALLLPMMTPPIVVGIVWKTMLLPVTGPFAFVFGSVGLQWPNVLATSLSMLAVILMDVWQSTPFVMLILLAGLQSIPPRSRKPPRLMEHGLFRCFET